MRASRLCSLLENEKKGENRKMTDRTSADALREHYGRVSDEELLSLVAQGETTYTEVAWAVLQGEVSRRGLLANIEPAEASSDTPAIEPGKDQWEKHHNTRVVIFAVIGTIGFLISLWRFASGDAGDAVFGLGIGLYFWYNVLLKPSGLKEK